LSASKIELPLLKHQHLLGTAELSPEYIEDILQAASVLKNKEQPEQSLKGKLVATLFYEASTRTRVSFEIAAKKLGADVIDLNPSASSVQKGETIADTARTLANLKTDLVILRHGASGAALELAKALSFGKTKVVNAGDGLNEHPTQALLDLFSIRQVDPATQGKKVVILGDAFHSRVARSNIYLLQKFGCKITLAGPPTFVPPQFAELGVEVKHCLSQALKGADYIIVLRLQKERQALGLISSLADYTQSYGLNKMVLAQNGLDLKKIKVLHPGPVNRGVEIDSELADDDEISLIHKQVSNGLYVRMAVLQQLLRE
jgi:aspartate carbamoyltransferase catalytic subunit